MGMIISPMVMPTVIPTFEFSVLAPGKRRQGRPRVKESNMWIPLKMHRKGNVAPSNNSIPFQWYFALTRATIIGQISSHTTRKSRTNVAGCLWRFLSKHSICKEVQLCDSKQQMMIQGFKKNLWLKQYHKKAFCKPLQPWPDQRQRIAVYPQHH